MRPIKYVSVYFDCLNKLVVKSLQQYIAIHLLTDKEILPEVKHSKEKSLEVTILCTFTTMTSFFDNYPQHL